MNGLTYLTPCLNSHWPLDLVIVMLGTNDLKKRFSLPAVDIAAGVGVLLDAVKRATPAWAGQPQLLLIAPPPIECIGWLGETFADGDGPSRRLASLYASQATMHGASFVDAAATVKVSPIDGIHLDAGDHKALGLAVALAVSRIVSV